MFRMLNNKTAIREFETILNQLYDIYGENFYLYHKLLNISRLFREIKQYQSDKDIEEELFVYQDLDTEEIHILAKEALKFVPYCNMNLMLIK